MNYFFAKIKTFFNKIKEKNFFIIVFLLLVLVFGLGYEAGKSSVLCRVCPPEEINFSLFWEAWDKLSQKYINFSQVEEKEMIYGAISGMTKSLGDPYTVFFSPNETKNFLEEVGGSFEGVGMEVGMKNGQLQVIAPLEGTPAFRAGLKAGDKIIKIDDKSTANMTIEEAVSYIKGPKGTTVVLTILREGKKGDLEEISIPIVRDVIEIPSISWELKNNGQEDVAYIKIYHFNRNTDYKFAQAAQEILKSPAKKIILDLRNNPGGYLEVAVDIAGWFLPKNAVVVIEDFAGKEEEEVFKARGNSALLNYPTVVLINEGSASASEILAGALRENRNIKLIGTKSFGKGSVQEMENLSDGSSLKITIAQWLTPKKNYINEKGLEPDIKVEMDKNNIDQQKDPQLEKALEIIKEIR